MMETFAWAPEQQNVAEEVQFRVLSAKFGDGYEQSAGDGLNARESTWSLTFFGRQDRIDAIKDFLDGHAGWRSFLWAPPGQSTAIVVTCKAYSRPHGGGEAWRLSATFERGFRP